MPTFHPLALSESERGVDRRAWRTAIALSDARLHPTQSQQG